MFELKAKSPEKLQYVCIYHKADMDGWCSGAIINKYINCVFKKSCYFIGLNYEPDLKILSILDKFTNLKNLFIVDYHIDPETVNALTTKGINIVLLDHHKTFIDKFKNNDLFEITTLKSNNDILSNFVTSKISIIKFKDDVNRKGKFVSWYSEKMSGALLAAYYVKEVTKNGTIIDFLTVNYKDRINISGVLLVAKLVSVYDTWDHTDEDEWMRAYWFNLTCKYENLYPTKEDWEDIFYNGKRFNDMINTGKSISRYIEKQNSITAMSAGGTLKWKGKSFCIINGHGNSLLLDSVFDPSIHDAILIYSYSPKYKQWKISMYTNEKTPEKIRKNIDLSEIAKEYGGGGHKGACGFSIKELPFDIYSIEPLTIVQDRDR